ncbi:MAG TPA: DUF3592 domain-containing protein, partial [Afipia sp.]
IGWMVVIAVILVFGSAIGFHKLTDFVSTKLVNPEVSGVTVALGAFGSVIALFAWGLHRQASLAKKWPVVPGRIKTSGLEQFRGKADEGRSRGPIMFRAKISYDYRYQNADYTGFVASMSGQVSSTSDWGVQRFVKKYRDGQTVDVYVNPQNPSEAVLEPRVTGAWILWLSAIAIWGLAYYVATKG